MMLRIETDGRMWMNVLGLIVALGCAGVPTACAQNVTGVVAGGSLTLTGGPGDDSIIVDSAGLAADQFRVTPQGSTTVGGMATPEVFSGVTKDLQVSGGEGTNTIVLTGLFVPGAVAVTGGAGADVLHITASSSVQGKLKVDLGGGTNATTIDTFTGVQGDVSIKGGAGADSFQDQFSGFGGKVTLGFGDGSNAVNIHQGTIHGAFTFKGGSGPDSFDLSEAFMEAKTTVLLGAGSNTAALTNVEVSGAFTYKGGADDDTIVLTHPTFPAPATFTVGAGPNTLTFNSAGVTIVDSDITYKGGAGPDVVHLGDTIVVGKMTIGLGAGVNDFLMMGGQVDTILKVSAGKGVDTFTLDATAIAGGTFDAGGGANTFIMRNVAALVGDGIGPLVVKGKDGDDTVTCEASAANGMRFLLGAGANTMSLQDCSVLGDLNVKTGGGNDTIVFGGSTSVSGQQTINLGGGSNIGP